MSKVKISDDHALPECFRKHKAVSTSTGIAKKGNNILKLTRKEIPAV